MTSTVLLACPAREVGGEWYWRWKELIEEWEGGWDTSALQPAPLLSWRKRALEQGGNRWVILADPGCAPGVVALFQALQVLALRPRVGCVCLLPPEWLDCVPEIHRESSSLWIAPFAPGGVAIVKGSAVSQVGYPETRFYPYDLAEMTFNMTRNGLEVLLLPDPSFLGPPKVRSYRRRLKQAWCEGNGSASFRLAHKGQAPRSLRMPENGFSLLLLSPWIIGAMAWRYGVRAGHPSPGPAGGSMGASSPAAGKGLGSALGAPLRALWALPEGVAFQAGVLRAYLRR